MNNKKPNLSILITSFTSGGAEKVISLLLKYLVLDFNVTLVLFYNELHFPIPSEVETILLSENKPSNNIVGKLLDLYKFRGKYKKILTEKRIEISLSFLAFPNLINGLLSTKNRNYSTLISERGYPSDNTTSKVSLLISKVFYPWLYNRCDRLFSNSTFINQDLKENFGVKIPMEVIYNPIELNNSSGSSISKIGTESNVFNLITVGSVDTRKNQIMIIKALKSLDTADSHLDIYGSGPMEAYLSRKISEWDLNDRVILQGRTKQVNQKLAKSDCFILSSYTEGFPNALLEAMAMGLPCISTNCLSGPLEMLNDNLEVDIPKGGYVKAKYGILVNNDDHVGLSKAIQLLKEDIDLRIHYGKLSKERSKFYDLPKIYDQFKAFVIN